MSTFYNPALVLLFNGIQYSMWMITADQILRIKRYSPIKTYVLMLLFLPAFLSIAFLPGLSLLRIAVGFLIPIVPIMLCYREKWYGKLLVALLIFMTVVAAEMLALQFLPRDPIPFSYQLTLYLLHMFFQAALLTLLVVFQRIMREESLAAAIKQSLFFVLFPLSQILAFFGWFVRDPPSITVTGTFSVFATVLAIAADMVLLVALRDNARTSVLKAQNEFLSMQANAGQAYYAEIAAGYENIRKMRHDIDNHLYTIKALLADDRAEEAAAYAEELYRARIYAQPTAPGCENPVVASYLLHKQTELSEKGITLEMHLEIPAHLSVTNTDLISTFGNLLDNAADACQDVQEARIHVYAGYIEPYLRIEVRNPAPDRQQEKPRRISELPRGLGQRILQRLAEKYDGYFQHEQVDGSYVSRLFLKNIAPEVAGLPEEKKGGHSLAEYSDL